MLKTLLRCKYQFKTDNYKFKKMLHPINGALWENESEFSKPLVQHLTQSSILEQAHVAEQDYIP